LIPILPANIGKLVHIRCDEMIFDNIIKQIEPEKAHFGESPTFTGNWIIHHYVIGRDSVGSYHKELVVMSRYVIHISDLAAMNKV
jgi:hypothetical protein